MKFRAEGKTLLLPLLSYNEIRRQGNQAAVLVNQPPGSAEILPGK